MIETLSSHLLKHTQGENKGCDEPTGKDHREMKENNTAKRTKTHKMQNEKKLLVNSGSSKYITSSLNTFSIL